MDAGTFSTEMMEKAEITTGFLKSLSHPARLVILCRLAEGPATVGEIEAFVGLPQAEVSKHLARLRSDDLVLSERRGRSIVYRLKQDRTARVVRILHHEFCR
ncbi:MAG: metalloregulator ArsR/SmtB family transcription factor [Rhodobacteraceae bacterium]|nr:metalloregulator ArsR/SmtB family transcription factor [Paracoccaceae bacterium]